MYHHFNIQQLYALPTLLICFVFVSENKQRLVPHTSYAVWICTIRFNPLQPSVHYMYHQFTIQQMYTLRSL